MAIRKKPIQKATTRVNDMLAFIIGIYILLTGMQMWLLFGTIICTIQRSMYKNLLRGQL